MSDTIDERLARAGLPPLPRGAWLEVDLDALAHNLQLMRDLAGPAAVWAVVKADAYGHGIELAARTFLEAGAERLCVATLDEALLLRSSAVSAPIVVLFPIRPEALEEAVEGDVELAASDVHGTSQLLARWRALAGDSGDGSRRLRLHLEIESGLGRAGVLPTDSARVGHEIVATPGAELAGAWTHLTEGEDAAVTAGQVEAFESALAAMRGEGIEVGRRHLAASAALIAATAPAYEAVRPGLALYGLMPPGMPSTDGVRRVAARLRPALSLKARPLRVETLPAGSGVSYGRRWTAGEPSRIASLPLGYGDGWSRAYWPGAEALVRGRPVPLVGVVAMDSLMADVTGVPDVGLDDEFVLLGEQAGEKITADDLAHRRTTISWEVLTDMAQRLPRVYHARAVPLAVRTLLGDFVRR